MSPVRKRYVIKLATGGWVPRSNGLFLFSETSPRPRTMPAAERVYQAATYSNRDLAERVAKHYPRSAVKELK